MPTSWLIHDGSQSRGDDQRAWTEHLEVDHLTDFHSPLIRHGNLHGNGNSLVDIFGLDHEIAAQLFMRLRKWAIGHQPFAITNPNRGRLGGRMERIRSHVLSPRSKFFFEL